VTGSPGYTAGGAAAAVSVTGGAFLHPIGTKTRPAEASTRKTDIILFRLIRFLHKEAEILENGLLIRIVSTLLSTGTVKTTMRQIPHGIMLPQQKSGKARFCGGLQHLPQECAPEKRCQRVNFFKLCLRSAQKALKGSQDSNISKKNTTRQPSLMIRYF
jgi:hypothetical protein